MQVTVMIPCHVYCCDCVFWKLGCSSRDGNHQVDVQILLFPFRLLTTRDYPIGAGPGAALRLAQVMSSFHFREFDQGGFLGYGFFLASVTPTKKVLFHVLWFPGKATNRGHHFPKAWPIYGREESLKRMRKVQLELYMQRTRGVPCSLQHLDIYIYMYTYVYICILYIYIYIYILMCCQPSHARASPFWQEGLAGLNPNFCFMAPLNVPAVRNARFSGWGRVFAPGVVTLQIDPNGKGVGCWGKLFV